MLYDAGLMFVAYQRDPRSGFIKIYSNMSKLDALNQFTTHTGGGLFACPAGRPGRRIHRRALVPAARVKPDRVTQPADGVRAR